MLRKTGFQILVGVLAVTGCAGSPVLPGQVAPVALQPNRPVPYEVIPPANFRSAIENGTRSLSGRPGPAYWQQWTRYEINTTLNTEEKTIDGTAAIMYFNNSPDTLNSVVLQLILNVHAEGAVRSFPLEVTGGINLSRVAVGGAELDRGNLGDRVSGTNLNITLPRSLLPGDSLRLDIDWSFEIPQQGAEGRMGWSRDNLFHIAYWYPQMAVYDDVVGWQTDRFTGEAEFYAGFGSYDVTIDVPEGWLVMATGSLDNRAEVLALDVLERLELAEVSDTIVHIITPSDFGPGRATSTSEDGRLRWHFVADSVRDFAFSVTRESRWDAARSAVGDRDGDGTIDYARVDAIWRETAPLWSESARYAQHSVEFLSRFTALPYPWPHMTAIEGEDIIGGGMEFPMMTLIGSYNGLSDSSLYYVTAHEIAHMWAPMTVSSDERRYGWMDEGSTSFNENQARKEFFPGFDHDDPDRQSYVTSARLGSEGEMMTWTDYLQPGTGRVASYRKPATALAALRHILGEETFLNAWRAYLTSWAFKHPKPWDFFNTFQSISGQNLDWFWHSWYYETWTLDQAVENVEPTDEGSTITITDHGYMPMPVYLTVTSDNGRKSDYLIPVDRWLTGARTAWITVGERSISRVEIDAPGLLPDVNRENNVWERDALAER